MDSNLTSKLLELEAKVIEIILPSDANKQYQTGKISNSHLEKYVKEIKGLSGSYLAAKQVLLSKAQIEAYALYYLPINFAKLCFLIDRIKSEQNDYLNQKALKVLDFGCGPASGLAACLYSQINIESLTAIDESRACLDFSSKLINKVTPDTKLISSSEFEKAKQNKYDLIIAANVLTELTTNQRQQTLIDLKSMLSEDAYLIILEPALFKTTRKLMQDRDLILKSFGDLSVIFPCTIQCACPMLNSSDKGDDWCHGTLASKFWEPSNLVKQLDHLLDFNKHRLKYSSMIFKKSKDIKTYSGRIINTSGKNKIAEICGQQGLVKIRVDNIKDVQVRRDLKANDNYRLIDNMP